MPGIKRKKTTLPPGKYRMGGKHFKNDDAFVRTAVRDVKRLERLADLNEGSRLLDWGCGAGRLAVGVREHFASGRIEEYHGVDVQPDLIGWARENLTAPGYRFTCVDVANERYNPAGLPQRTLATDPDSVDVFYAYSVFSHMNDEDTAAYLKLIGQALSAQGKAFVNWGRAICLRAEISQSAEDFEGAYSLFVNASDKFVAAMDSFPGSSAVDEAARLAAAALVGAYYCAGSLGLQDDALELLLEAESVLARRDEQASSIGLEIQEILSSLGR